ncbi:MAG: single-stranded DNA-binding protein [Beijerinckiaceae bacterium]|nr:MAG: single-stranded DNA-binding protein [Beijerinckiaceae bacterium]
MTAFAIVTGSLWKPPERRVAKSGGRPFVTATIRVKDGEASQWWRIVAFSEGVQTELMRLGDGDSVCVQGAFKAELYKPESGDARVFLSIIADHVLALRQPKIGSAAYPRKARKERDAPAQGGAAAFNDSIPFGAHDVLARHSRGARRRRIRRASALSGART